MKLTNTERLALVDVIDGTIDSMDELKGKDFTMWMALLRRLGRAGVMRANEWEQAAKE